jgi:hypothetical protein
LVAASIICLFFTWLSRLRTLKGTVIESRFEKVASDFVLTQIITGWSLDISKLIAYGISLDNAVSLFFTPTCQTTPSFTDSTRLTKSTRMHD